MPIKRHNMLDLISGKKELNVRRFFETDQVVKAIALALDDNDCNDKDIVEMLMEDTDFIFSPNTFDIQKLTGLFNRVKTMLGNLNCASYIEAYTKLPPMDTVTYSCNLHEFENLIGLMDDHGYVLTKGFGVMYEYLSYLLEIHCLDDFNRIKQLDFLPEINFDNSSSDYTAWVIIGSVKVYFGG